jgi:hypothetical protein
MQVMEEEYPDSDFDEASFLENFSHKFCFWKTYFHFFTINVS